MFLEHFSESKHQQQRGIPETNSEKPSLAEPISTAACYDWPITETAEAEAFHDHTDSAIGNTEFLFINLEGRCATC